MVVGTLRRSPTLLLLLLQCTHAYHAHIALPRCRRHAPPALNLFEGAKWPWDQQTATGSEAGQFLRHSQLNPGGAPLGVLCAGFDEDALEAIGMAVEAVYRDADGGQMQQVPIAVVSADDLRLPLKRVLAELDARDSVLPDVPARPRVPLVMLSGFSTVATSATVRAIRSLGLTGGEDDSTPMFAVAVPNALDKSLKVLIDEISGDHLANKAKNQQP